MIVSIRDCETMTGIFKSKSVAKDRLINEYKIAILLCIIIMIIGLTLSFQSFVSPLSVYFLSVIFFGGFWALIYCLISFYNLKKSHLEN